MDDLAFENSTLKKDFKEAHKLLKQTQEKLIAIEVQEQKRASDEKLLTEQMEMQRQVIEETQSQQKETKEVANSLRSAFNADRKILQDKIDDLEKKLTNRIKEN